MSYDRNSQSCYEKPNYHMRLKEFNVPGCKYDCYCCKIGPFNKKVNGDWILCGASLEWTLVELQFLALLRHCVIFQFCRLSFWNKADGVQVNSGYQGHQVRARFEFCEIILWALLNLIQQARNWQWPCSWTQIMWLPVLCDNNENVPQKPKYITPFTHTVKNDFHWCQRGDC